MGVSVSLLRLAWVEIMSNKIFASINESEVMNSSCFSKKDINSLETGVSFEKSGSQSRMKINRHFEHSLSFNNWEQGQVMVEDTLRTKDQDVLVKEDSSSESTQNLTVLESNPTQCLLLYPGLQNELDVAAIKLQKVYKSYRTRRNLADCAVVAEELWWKALDFASLKHSSISFFHDGQHETAVSRWARARTRAAKVGKGLSKDQKAQKLVLRHWLEAIDPRHRYGHNLHLYYDVWFESESSQPFFYWLDVGDGKEVNLEKCPRSKLQQQCVKYLGPKEREAYEIIMENGKLAYKQSGKYLDTTEGSKWIFVLSTTRALYVGQKKKGLFHHSSFLAGGATTASGRLVAKEGVLKAVWPYSGHYLPTEENFKQLINFLQENNVDLTGVETSSIDRDDEYPSFKKTDTEQIVDIGKSIDLATEPLTSEEGNSSEAEAEVVFSQSSKYEFKEVKNSKPTIELCNYLPCKWSTGAGPRIRCVRDYPTDLQCEALKQVNLSPRIRTSPGGNKDHIPSPRPSPAMRLSPTLANMRFPAPTISLIRPPNLEKGEAVC